MKFTIDRIIIIALLCVILGMASPALLADDNPTFDIVVETSILDAEYNENRQRWSSTDCVIDFLEFERHD